MKTYFKSIEGTVIARSKAKGPEGKDIPRERQRWYNFKEGVPVEVDPVDVKHLRKRVKLVQVGPVETVKEAVKEAVEDPKPIKKSKEEAPKGAASRYVSDGMLDDYLSQNWKTVVKKIREDPLTSLDIQKLTDLELKRANRTQVFQALEAK